MEPDRRGIAGPLVEVVHAADRPAPAVAWCLSAAEQERLARLRSEADRDRYATAHALLRQAVARWVAAAPEALVFGATCRRCGGPHGRPELRSPPPDGLQLSLSRSGPRAVVAVTRLGPIGVDCSGPIADDFTGFDGVALAPPEQAAIDELDPAARPRARGVLWARKEAVLKATGQGLLTSPDRVEVSPPNDAPRLVRWWAEEASGPPPAVHLLDLTLPHGACGAVAVLSERAPALVLRGGDELLDQA